MPKAERDRRGHWRVANEVQEIALAFCRRSTAYIAKWSTGNRYIFAPRLDDASLDFSWYVKLQWYGRVFSLSIESSR